MIIQTSIKVGLNKYLKLNDIFDVILRVCNDNIAHKKKTTHLLFAHLFLGGGKKLKEIQNKRLAKLKCYLLPYICMFQHKILHCHIMLCYALKSYV